MFRRMERLGVMLCSQPQNSLTLYAVVTGHDRRLLWEDHQEYGQAKFERLPWPTLPASLEELELLSREWLQPIMPAIHPLSLPS